MIMKILIAEDEKSIASSLEKRLTNEGFEPSVVYDGESALKMINKNSFDVILLDWKMPKITGFDVCKKIREIKITTPIIFLTVLGDISNKVEALKAGADDYITKPFAIEELLARIQSVLRRMSLSEKKMHCGSFTLDLVTHYIENKNYSLKLSDKEFELLHYLIINKGMIINKYTLFENVWGLNFSPETNFVEVTIKNLRKKMEELTSKKYIKTVYGEGYVFVGE